MTVVAKAELAKSYIAHPKMERGSLVSFSSGTDGEEHGGYSIQLQFSLKGGGGFVMKKALIPFLLTENKFPGENDGVRIFLGQLAADFFHRCDGFGGHRHAVIGV